MKTIYQYDLAVNAKSLTAESLIFLKEINSYKVTKETEKTYTIKNDKFLLVREGETGWRTHSNPGEQLLRKCFVENFRLRSHEWDGMILTLQYSSFKKYSKEQIINKSKKYLKSYFKKVLDNMVD